MAAPQVPQRLVEALEALGAGVVVKQFATGTYLQASHSLDRLFERSESTLVGSNDGELMRPDEVQAMRRVEVQVMQQGGLLSTEHRLDLGGKRREFLVVRLPLDDQHLLCAWLERTQERHREVHLQRALAQIEQLQQEVELLRRDLQKGSGRDELTGLQQTGPFNELLEREIDLSTREHREFSLVLVALDLPEDLSELQQQRLLEALGRLLRANTRAMDAASRVAGSVFAVLLSGVGLATAHARMEQLRRQCAQQIVAFEGRDLGLSVSLGVSSFPHSASSHETLLDAAQQALRLAQRRGGNQVSLASIPLGA
jgi:diguanylate cyclase (GGDEF)-like protein